MKPLIVTPLCTLLVASTACSQAPAEPIGRSAEDDGRTAALPTGGDPTPEPSTRTPGSQALEWEIPAGWSVERAAERGTYRTKAQIPPVGNDRVPAELLVRHLGRSSSVDVDSEIGRWMSEFDGDVSATARREIFEVGAIAVRLVELAGDYQQPMGPPIGPRGKHPAYVIQQGWRGIGAFATTAQQEVWLFRLVGPDETVRWARSAMLTMLRSLRVPGHPSGLPGKAPASVTSPPTAPSEK